MALSHFRWAQPTRARVWMKLHQLGLDVDCSGPRMKSGSSLLPKFCRRAGAEVAQLNSVLAGARAMTSGVSEARSLETGRA